MNVKCEFGNKKMTEILRNGTNFNNSVINCGSIANSVDTEFTSLTMVKDQGHKHLNNESGFQSDDELTNTTEIGTNPFCEVRRERAE